MSILNTFEPIEGDPAHYTVTVGAKTSTIPRDQADKLREDAKKRMQTSIARIGDLCNLAVEDYSSQKKVDDDQKLVSGSIRLFKYIGSLGKVHDPKKDIDKLVGIAKMDLATAAGMIAANVFGPSTGLIADAEGLALQAGKIARVWSNELVDGASTAVTGLTHTRNISFGVMAGLAAIGPGGAAGAVAAAVVLTMADVTGKALARQKIDWSGAVIDMTVNLIATKFSGQAEAAIKKAVAAQVTKRMAGKLSGVALEKLAENIREKAAKPIVDKGSDILKSVTKSVAAKLQGKDITFGETADDVVKELRDPNSKESSQAKGLIESLLKDAVGKAAAPA